jgi:transcriptional regulator with XRE-family HTH domain
MEGGDLVREARRRAGLTQRGLAELAGTTQSAIARLEGGRTGPSFASVVRLVRLCGYRLHVSLDPYDGSDIAQAEALLKLPIDERMGYLVDTVEGYRQLREEVARQIG